MPKRKWAPDPHGLLPRVGISTEALLQTYGEHQLSALAREPRTKALHMAAASAHRLLLNALHARELTERLATRAERLALQSEAEVERAIIDIERGLRSPKHAALRDKIFSSGLASAIAVRCEAQISEALRICAELAEQPGAPSSKTLIRATLGLHRRLLALTLTHRSVIDAIVAERECEWAFRASYRRTAGEVAALFEGVQGALGRFFKAPADEHGESDLLPEAPPVRAQDRRARARSGRLPHRRKGKPR